MSIILCYGCGRNVKDGDSLIIQPGHFCQLGAVETVGETLFIAGSFVAEENPNVSVSPVHSYLAAVSVQGRVLWELNDEMPDYTRWTHLQAGPDGLLFVAGVMDSPLEGYAMVVKQISTNDGGVAHTRHIKLSTLPRIQQLVAYMGMGLLYTLADQPQCTNIQFWPYRGDMGTAVLTHCQEGAVQAAKWPANTLDAYVAYGNGVATEHLYFYPDRDTYYMEMPLSTAFRPSMVNDMAVIARQHLWAATTIKNKQGPCLWLLGADSADARTVCLEYWPFHGNAKLLRYGDNVLVAFNASSEASEHNAHVAMIDTALQTVWQQTIATSHPFIVQGMAFSGNNLYVAGTLEMDKEGSAIAVKVLLVP